MQKDLPKSDGNHCRLKRVYTLDAQPLVNSVESEACFCNCCLWFQLAFPWVSFPHSMDLHQSPISSVHLNITYFLDKPSLRVEKNRWKLLGGGL